jgi:catechol 2,3-dioxygenase-like lactoylglutathione lyase family enzyme
MTQCIHHINFLVRDLEQAIPAWQQLLGRAPDSRDHLPGRGVDIARYRLGETWLSLVQPVREGTEPARYLAEHGEGFFLISLALDSLDQAAERLGEDSFSGPARAGLEDWRIRDLKPADFAGVQVQLTETGG